MLLHLSPTFISDGFFTPLGIHTVSIPEIGLELTGGLDIVARQPHANKRYYTACRKVGRKAIDGILVDVPKPLTQFSLVSTWRITGLSLMTHRVHYTLADSDFSFVSDNLILWGERRHASTKEWNHAIGQPRMVILPEHYNAREFRDIQFTQDEFGFVETCTESITIPTLPLTTLDDSRYFNERLPLLTDVFTVTKEQET